MSNSPWVKFYHGDFLAGVGGLTVAERGVYITLICLIYESDGPLALDDARLARRCGLKLSAFRRILDGLLEQGKLVETPEGLTNARCEAEIAERLARSSAARDSARQRWAGSGRQEGTQWDSLGRRDARLGRREPRPSTEIKGKNGAGAITFGSQKGNPADSPAGSLEAEKIERKQGAPDAKAMRGQCYPESESESDSEPSRTRTRDRAAWARIASLADLLEKPGAHIPPNAISDDDAETLIELGVVTEEQLRERGLR